MAANRTFSMAFELGGRLASSFNAAFSAAQGRMGKLKDASESLNKVSGAMGKGILAAGGAVAAAAGSMMLYVNSVAQADDLVRTLSESVGANVKEVEYLGAAIAPLGMDFEKAVDMQEEFVNKWGESRSLVNKGLAEGMNLTDATDEAVGGMRDAYAMLGLDLAESIKKPADVAAKEFYDAILKHGNNAEAQSAADIMLGGDANKIFGSLRSQGFSTMDGLYDKFGALDSRTDESRKNLEKFTKSMSMIQFAASSLSKEFAGLLGGALQPVVDKSMEWMKANKELVGTKLKEWADGIAGSIQWVINNFEQIVFWAKAIGTAVAIFAGLAMIIKAVTIATTVFNAVMMVNPIVLIVGAIALLGAGIYWLIQKMGGFTAIWDGAKSIFSSFGSAVASVWGKVKGAFSAGIEFIKSVFTKIDSVFANNPVLNFLLPMIGIPRILMANWGGIKTFFGSLWTFITDKFNVGVAFIGAKLGAVYGFFASIWNNIATFLSGAWTRISGLVTAGIGAIVSAVMANPILQAFIAAWSSIFTFLATLKEKMLSIGSNIIQGLIEGIKSGFEGLKSIWNTVNSWIPDFAKKKMDIHSPSRVMAGIGGHITGGLGVGIQEGFPSVQSTMNSGMDSLMPTTTPTSESLMPNVSASAGVAPAAAASGGNSAPITVTITQNITGGADTAEQAKSGVMDAVKQMQNQSNRNSRTSFA